MDDHKQHIHRFHGMRPFTLDDEAIMDFLGIENEIGVLDVGGADGFYAKKFAARGARVTVIDNYDYEFSTLNSMGIKTIIQNFCNYSEGTFDIVFMAHVYHDLVLNCKEKTLENLREISPIHIGHLDFVKEDLEFGPPTSIKLEKHEVVSDMESIGYRLKKDTELPFHYLQLFEKK